jgi:NAD(P)H-hydrate epimerase
MTREAIQEDRLSAVKWLQKKFGGVAVLKGAGTLVDGPDAIPAICTAGNPGMATAGMGDILSGVIGGLLAQDIPLIAAAKLGVLIHALAGDRAAEEGERGMIASDLLPYLRFLVNP